MNNIPKHPMLMGLRKWQMVLVKWVDAFDAPAGWHDANSYSESECIIDTMGYYWADCGLDGYIVLAATTGYHGRNKPQEVSQVTHIPLGMIREIIPLKTVERKVQMKKPAKVAKVMGEYKRGTLKSSSGAKVKSRKQAVAIAMSEAGMSKPTKKRKPAKRKPAKRK
jgi:hypothetical protein